MPVKRLPLSYYVDLLERRVPFTYLSYGDGEFHAMSGLHNGQKFTQYEEVVTPEIAAEMRASLDVNDWIKPDCCDFCGPRKQTTLWSLGDGTYKCEMCSEFTGGTKNEIFRGTDEFIVEPETYGGNDKPVIFEANRVARMSIGDRKIDWVDGTIWDESVKNGLLGPLLKTLLRYNLVLVGNKKLFKITILRPLAGFFSVKDQNSLGFLDELEEKIWSEYVSSHWQKRVYVLCMGLGAIPLAMRIRGKIPGATVIDLGSALDVFAGLGADRGWRKELYADPERLKTLIEKNLEGV